MSLINDALKRARQSIQRKPSGGDEIGGMPPLQPAYGASKATDFDWGFVKLGLLALLVIGGIAFKVWPYLHKKSPVKAAVLTPARAATNRNNSSVAAAESATNNNPIARAKRTFDKVHDLHAEGEANYSMVDSKPAVPVARTPAATPPTIKAEATAQVQPSQKAETVPAVTAPISYKLQAIFFRENNPSARINGKSIVVGDEVDGAKVKAITAESVVLDSPAGAQELSFH